MSTLPGTSTALHTSPPHIGASHPRYSEQTNLESSKTLRAAGTGTGLQQTQVSVRGFSFVSDEPESIGGRDQGPTPMEYLAGAVNSCITVVIDQLAKRRGLPTAGVQTYTIAKQDTRGMAGTADVQPYAYAYRLQVAIATSETDQAALTAFAANAEHICPAINLLRDARTGLHVVWSFFDASAGANDALAEGTAEALSNTAWGYTTDHAVSPAPFFTVVNADAADQVVGA